MFVEPQRHIFANYTKHINIPQIFVLILLFVLTDFHEVADSQSNQYPNVASIAGIIPYTRYFPKVPQCHHSSSPRTQPWVESAETMLQDGFHNT